MQRFTRNPMMLVGLAALYVLTAIGGGLILNYALGSRAAGKPFRTTQQQGDIEQFVSPTAKPTEPPKANILVECGYGSGAPHCVPGNPKSCLDWAESKTLAAAQNPGTDGILHAWYSDERTLSLGAGTVSPMKSSPTDHVVNPNTGDPTAMDPSGRPIRPSLFITDITTDPNATTGDWENGGKQYDPSEIFGSWKAFNTADVLPPNGSDLGAGSTPVPPGTPMDEYMSEIRWNLLDPKFGLAKGHTYRLEFMLHDGDQRAGAGGDAGEKCGTISL